MNRLSTATLAAAAVVLMVAVVGAATYADAFARKRRGEDALACFDAYESFGRLDALDNFRRGPKYYADRKALDEKCAMVATQ